MQFIYEKVTNIILEKLEQNIVPWQKTWHSEFPQNFVTGRKYNGINLLLLGLEDYEQPYYLSFKQCKELGGSIKKDEHSNLVVFWKPVVKYSNNDLDETSADISFLLRYYYVFNISQCVLPHEVLKKKLNFKNNPKIMEADVVIKNYKSPPEIVHKNDIPNPRYFPRQDKIEIPTINSFYSSDEYYAALFHECIHSTGNRQRLARHGVMDTIQFGTENYSKEELVAEIGASILCNVSGIEKLINNQVSYIKNWLEVLRNDKRMILIAASQAQKACDYILQISSSKTVEGE